MSQVDAYCKGCQYLGTNSYGKWCRYNDVTGHVRGCPAGEGCVQYSRGPAKHIPNASPFASAYAKRKTTADKDKPSGEKTSRMTPEEAYERSKARKREAAKEFRAKTNGRQRAVILAYKQEHGYSNYDLSIKLGVCESTVNRWVTEYVPADWDKLAILGIEKPKELG